MPALIRGKRDQEIVDCHALTTRLLRQTESQDALVNRHVTIRWNDVDVVQLDWHLVRDFDHRQFGDALQDFRQHADVFGIQVLDQNECHAALRGRTPKKLLEGVQTPGGGANANDWKFRHAVDSCRWATHSPRQSLYHGGFRND